MPFYTIVVQINCDTVIIRVKSAKFRNIFTFAEIFSFTCTITNNAATAADGTSGALKAYIAKTVTIPADTTVDFGKIFIEANDKLWTQASATGDCSVYGSVLQIDN